LSDTALAEYHLLPGYLVIPREQTLVSGVVGSGMFVSLWDTVLRYSGCCSFRFSREAEAGNTNSGEVAIPHLISRMCQVGSQKADLRAHIIGGGVKSGNTYGERNRNVVHEILTEHSIEVLTEDTGGKFGRKFIYDTQSGEHVVMKVQALRREDWYPYTKPQEREDN